MTEKYKNLSDRLNQFTPTALFEAVNGGIVGPKSIEFASGCTILSKGAYCYKHSGGGYALDIAFDSILNKYPSGLNHAETRIYSSYEELCMIVYLIENYLKNS